MPFSVMNLDTLFFVEHFCRMMDYGERLICYIFHDSNVFVFSVLLGTEYKIFNDDVTE